MKTGGAPPLHSKLFGYGGVPYVWTLETVDTNSVTATATTSVLPTDNQFLQAISNSGSAVEQSYLYETIKHFLFVSQVKLSYDIMTS